MAPGGRNTCANLFPSVQDYVWFAWSFGARVESNFYDVTFNNLPFMARVVTGYMLSVSVAALKGPQRCERHADPQTLFK